MTDPRRDSRATTPEGELPELPSPTASDSMPAPPRTYLVDGRRLPAHPAAELFPLLDEAELKELTADVVTHGQRENVLLNAAGTQVVDGRNRCIACDRANIPVAFGKLPPDVDLVSVITSVNVHRRHLTTAQRAVIGAQLANLRRGGVAGKPKATQKIEAPLSPSDNSTENSHEIAVPESNGGKPQIAIRGKGLEAGGVIPVGNHRASRGEIAEVAPQGGGVATTRKQ